jgi:hypothetical protein
MRPLRAPPPEDCPDRFSLGGGDGFLGEPARDLDRRPELREGVRAPFAVHEVRSESATFRGIERTIQVAGEQFHQLAARDVGGVHEVTSLPR